MAAWDSLFVILFFVLSAVFLQQDDKSIAMGDATSYGKLTCQSYSKFYRAVTDLLACNLRQVTLPRLPRPLNES